MKNQHIILLLLVALFAVACNSTKKTNDQDNNQEVTGEPVQIDNKILVDLDKSTTPESLETEFVKYDLKMKSLASRSQNTYLFLFDSDKISAERLIKKINKINGVVSAKPLETKIGPSRTISSGNKKTVRLKKADQ